MSEIFDGNGLKENNVSIYQWELIRRDNQPCFVETSLSTISNNVSHQTGIRGVVRNVTKRIQVQNALLLSEEMFSKAFQSSPCGMFVADIENGRLINVNDSFLTFTGYNAATVLGKELLSLDFFKRNGREKVFQTDQRKEKPAKQGNRILQNIRRHPGQYDLGRGDPNLAGDVYSCRVSRLHGSKEA